MQMSMKIKYYLGCVTVLQIGMGNRLLVWDNFPDLSVKISP